MERSGGKRDISLILVQARLFIQLASPFRLKLVLLSKEFTLLFSGKSCNVEAPYTLFMRWKRRIVESKEFVRVNTSVSLGLLDKSP